MDKKENNWENIEKILEGDFDLDNEDLEILMETNVGMSMWLHNISLSERKKILGENPKKEALYE
jgi:hypothetical protein